MCTESTRPVTGQRGQRVTQNRSPKGPRAPGQAPGEVEVGQMARAALGGPEPRLWSPHGLRRDGPAHLASPPHQLLFLSAETSIVSEPGKHTPSFCHSF